MRYHECKRVRSRETSVGTVVLMSGAQGSIGRAHPQMFDAVLDKPYTEERLIEALKRVLEESGQGGE